MKTLPYRRLPPKRVLTVNLEVPEAWLVEPIKAVHDLDNLRLVRCRPPHSAARRTTRCAGASTCSQLQCARVWLPARLMIT